MDYVALTTAILTAFAVAAALASAVYAKRSAEAAKATVKPLQDLVVQMATVAQADTEVARSAADTAIAMQSANRLAVLVRAEARLDRELEQTQQVALALYEVREGCRQKLSSMPDMYLRKAMGSLVVALAALGPKGDLPLCAEVSGTHVESGSLLAATGNAINEIEQRLAAVHRRVLALQARVAEASPDETAT